jgi:SH3-like domain-containing protein
MRLTRNRRWARYIESRHPVISFWQVRPWKTALTLLLALGTLSACGRGRSRSLEVMYVSAPQAFLRDRVAAVYNKVGNVKNGDRVDVIDREKRWVKVRTADGTEGWLEQRFLIPQETFDAFQKLTKEHQNDPVQATGTTRNDTNLHIEPGRESEHLYLLPAGTKLQILVRGTAEKAGAVQATNPTGKRDNKAEGPPMEDWWLIRDAQSRAGWVLARMVDLDVPLEIAQYAEGERFVGFFVLNTVQDDDKKVPQYLALLSEPKDGQPYDYDKVHVFTWNVKKHRYETAYRERNLNGVLPATVTHEDFGKDGDLPVFILRVKDDKGNIVQRKYKLNTPIVKRVLAPGEEPSKPPRKPGAGHKKH